MSISKPRGAGDEQRFHTQEQEGKDLSLEMEGDRTFHLLPTYSSQLNIAETVWLILRGKLISPHDYATKQGLLRRVKEILSKIEKSVLHQVL